MISTLIWLDLYLLELGNRAAGSPWLDPMMLFVSDFGNFKIPIILGALAISWWGSPRQRVILVMLGVAVALTDMTGAAIKDLTDRPRPFHTLEIRQIEGLRYRSKSGSLPSNHAANCFAIATFLSLTLQPRRRLGPILGMFAIASLVAYSRVYLGVHYPSDVILGALLGGATGGLLANIFLSCFPCGTCPEGRPRWMPSRRVALLIAGLLLLGFVFLQGAKIISPERAVPEKTEVVAFRP